MNPQCYIHPLLLVHQYFQLTLLSHLFHQYNMGVVFRHTVFDTFVIFLLLPAFHCLLACQAFHDIPYLI